MTESKFIKYISAGIIIFSLFMVFASYMVVLQVSRDINSNGGLGKTIGKFINDVSSEIK